MDKKKKKKKDRKKEEEEEKKKTLSWDHCIKLYKETTVRLDFMK
jgi:hypothetical protein